MQQLRLRFPRRRAAFTSITDDGRNGAPATAWAVMQTGDEVLPYAVVELGEAGNFQARATVLYTTSLEAARAYVRDGSLAVTGWHAVRLARGIPARFGQVLEVWF